MIDAKLSLARDDFVLDVAFSAGEGVTALFGPSGAGKSTVLHLIAGLVRLDSGHIVVDDVVFADTKRGIALSPHLRRVGYVFQDALLFPHLNVRRNLNYGRWFSSGAPSLDFDQVIDLLGISRLLDRAPATLSGGERQRAAIGRALLSNPRLLLMDEPLAALDIERKAEIIPYIERLRDQLSIPILYVSHAVEEVARLADRVIALADGRIVAEGNASEILGPRLTAGSDRFARLAVLSGRNPLYDERYGLTTIEHPAGQISIPGRLAARHGDLRIVIRATDVALSLTRPNEISIRTTLKGVIVRIAAGEGAVAVAEVRLAGGDILAAAITRKAVDELGLDIGDAVFCLIKAVSIDERLMQAP